MFFSIPQPFYYAAGLVLMKGISFVMLPIVAGTLSPEQFGTLDIWLTLLNVGSILVGFGLIDALYKKHADSQRGALLLPATLRIQFKLAIISLILGCPILFLLQQFWQTLTWLDGILLFTTLALGAIFNIPLTWLRLKDNAKSFFILTSGKAFSQALLTFSFLKLGFGVTGVLMSGALSAVGLTVALLWTQCRGLEWSKTDSLEKELITYGKPIVLSGLLLFMAAGAERWILAGTLSLNAVAFYALAMQFALMIAFLCEPLTLWWFPKRLQLVNQPDGKTINAVFAEGISHICFWLALGMTLSGPYLFKALFPPEYLVAAKLLPWLALGVAFKQISHVINTGCYIGERPVGVLRINLLMAFSALITFTSASLMWGLSGVAIAFTALYAARAFLFYRESQRHLSLPYDKKRLITHSIFSILVIATNSIAPYALMACFALQTLWLMSWLMTQHSAFRNDTLLPSRSSLS